MSRGGEPVVVKAPVPLVMTCAQCRSEVLEADRLGDEEECALRDHLLASHPKTVQPHTLSVLLKHFIVIGRPRRQRSRVLKAPLAPS